MLLLAAPQADRYPLRPLPALVALIGPPLGAGLLARTWWATGLAVVPLGLGVVSASAGPDPFASPAFGALLGVAALALVPLGVAIGRAQRIPTAASVVLVLGALAVLPAAALERARTVRVDRKDPLPLDERAGTFRGVGLGDSPATSRRRVGP